MYNHYSKRSRRRGNQRGGWMTHLAIGLCLLPLPLCGSGGDMEESGLPQQWTDPWLRGKSKAPGKEQAKKRKRRAERAEVGLLHCAQWPVNVCVHVDIRQLNRGGGRGGRGGGD